MTITTTNFSQEELQEINAFLSSLKYFNYHLVRLDKYEINFLITRANELKIPKMREYLEYVWKTYKPRQVKKSRCKRIKNIVTGKTYESLKAAAIDSNLTELQFRRVMQKEPGKYVFV